jgi:outer membrane protein assembly factor BamB
VTTPPEPAKETQLERTESGHFYTYATVNGQLVKFIVDTGADVVALTPEDAERAGVKFNPADFVVVADLEGYVHWFDRATGAVAARAKTGGDRVTNAPLSVDGTVYVITDKGDIAALRGSPVAARAAKAEPAPAPAGAVSPPPGG